jgi:hypothetical protein
MSYYIAWREKGTRRWKGSKKVFTKEEAEALAKEFNESFPNLEHAATEEGVTPFFESDPAPVNLNESRLMGEVKPIMLFGQEVPCACPLDPDKPQEGGMKTAVPPPCDDVTEGGLYSDSKAQDNA